jgi:hypothetical protein
MNKAEKELQIKLAEEDRKLTVLLAKLNADLQVQLAEELGLAALSVASFVGSYQFYISSPSPWNWLLFYCLFPFAVATMFGAILMQQKLKKTMKKLRELK